MELQLSKFYYIKEDKLIQCRDILDVPMNYIFCYVDSGSFHFGKRNAELIAQFLREDRKENNNTDTLYNKLVDICQDKKYV